jgi:saccharopine dehydrogenase-like NADP-dependent oxidoreductase
VSQPSDRPTKLVIVGSGSLARAICYSLSGLAVGSAEILVLARAREKAAEICQISQVQARLTGSAARFTALSADLHDEPKLARLLAEQRNPRQALHRRRPDFWLTCRAAARRAARDA